MLKPKEVTKFDSVTNQNVNEWLNGKYDQKTKENILKLLNENPNEIIDAFYKKLSFGTGGMRGIIGIGSNRMNEYTVQAATQGLANYLKKQPLTQREHAVFIGYDSRHYSRLFSEEASKVLAGNGIRVYLCESLRPTPLISFGCRFKKCSAAIMITASHNPPNYNGFKVFWNDGSQVLEPHDQGIIQEVNLVKDLDMIRKVDRLDHDLIQIIGQDIDEAYLAAIKSLQLYPGENKSRGQSLKIVYTSLHGTGIVLIPKAFEEWGFTNVEYVKEQIIPDSDFPTVASPNPEEKNALEMGINKLKETKGDILIATDPDADRVGVVVNHYGNYEILNGNQIACICLQHICQALNEQNKMPENAAFVKTIATTELFQSIAKEHNRPCFNVLTGFKYIAEKIRLWEKSPQGYQFIFGGEESYGYLFGTMTRDKDAIVSSTLICEAALHAKCQGKTLIDFLHEIWKKHGVYVEKLLSVNFEESKAGHEQLTKGMTLLQSSPPKTINEIKVDVIEDYKKSIRFDLKNGKTDTIDLPKSNVLLFWLEDGSKLIIRPSGTEPKIKLYCGVSMKDFNSIPETVKACETKADQLLNSLKNQLKG